MILTAPISFARQLLTSTTVPVVTSWINLKRCFIVHLCSRGVDDFELSGTVWYSVAGIESSHLAAF
jgi:hypothetical protein